MTNLPPIINPPPPPPVLDLHGGTNPTLHRPRIAAVAMMLLAVASALLVITAALYLLGSWGIFAPGSRRTSDTFQLRMALITAASLLQFLSLVFFAIAHLGRGKFNPWPWLVLLLAGLAYTTLEIARSILFYATFPGTLGRPPTALMYLNMIMPGAAFLTWLAALLYAMQFAAYLHSRALALAAAPILGLQLALSVMRYANALSYYFGVGSTLLNSFEFNELLLLLRALSYATLAAFCFVLAILLAVAPKHPTPLSS